VGEAAIVEWFFKKRQRRSEPMPGNAMRVLSFLTPAECGSLGLPGVAVQGTFTDEECSAGGFRPNPVFIEFMHEVIRRAGPTDADMQDAAAGQQNGWLYVIDLRTPDGPQGQVPLEDIIGAFEVKNGGILPDSYWPNEQHRVLTENGPVQLPPSFRQALVDAALEHARHQDLRGGTE
jgi:hypothetical protein